MPLKDPLVELTMPFFLMPPLDLRHGERVPPDVVAQMARVSTRVLFPGRKVRLRAVKNVYVAEQGLVIHQDLAVEQSSLRGQEESTITRARNAIVEGRKAGSIGRIDGDVVLCISPGAWNYGHWLIEMLPMAYVAAKHWPNPARFLLYAAEGHMRAVVREAFDLLGIPAVRRVETGGGNPNLSSAS